MTYPFSLSERTLGPRLDDSDFGEWQPLNLDNMCLLFCSILMMLFFDNQVLVLTFLFLVHMTSKHHYGKRSMNKMAIFFLKDSRPNEALMQTKVVRSLGASKRKRVSQSR